MADLTSYVQQIHGNKVVVAHNQYFEELDRRLNDVLRDIAQKEVLVFEAMANELRDLIVRINDSARFELSLSKAKKIVKDGGSIEEATLQLYYPEAGTAKNASFLQQAEKILSKHSSPPLWTGLDVIDSHGGLERENILVLGGDTGGQKTRSTLWLSLQMLIQNPNVRCAFFEREMTSKDVFYMVCSYLLALPYLKIREWPKDFLLAKLEEQGSDALNIVDRLDIFDSQDFRTAEDVFYLVNRHKPAFWVIDFLTMMVSGESSSDGVNQSVFNLVDKFKMIAQKTDSLGILVSQLKKGTVENRANKVPTMDDFEWSGRIKHIAAYAFSVFWPSYYDGNVNRRYFYIKDAKNRYGERYWIYLHAYPEIGTFRVPNEMERYEMEAWIKDYITGRLK